MTISKIKYPRIDFTGFINGDSNNQLAVDSNGKLKVGLSAGDGVELSAAGVISAKINNTTYSQATDESASAAALARTYSAVNNTAVDTETISDNYYSFDVYPSTKRFDFTQSVNDVEYAFFPQQAGVIFVMRITKPSGGTISFDATTGITYSLDKTIESSWTSCTIIFNCWSTTEAQGFVIAGS